MLATGSEDFVDILIPLLTHSDRQVRLSTYDAGQSFHPSSIGPAWRQEVDGWQQDARADFVYEITHRGWMIDIGESFAKSDPSEKVRYQALQSLSWIGATDALARILNGLDDEALPAALPQLIPEPDPNGLRGRIVAADRRLLADETNPLARIRQLLKGAELGDPATPDSLMLELDRLSPPFDQYATHAIFRSAEDRQTARRRLSLRLDHRASARRCALGRPLENLCNLNSVWKSARPHQSARFTRDSLPRAIRHPHHPVGLGVLRARGRNIQ